MQILGGWVHDHLSHQIDANPKLAAYKGRFEVAVGSAGEDSNKVVAAARFAPQTQGKLGALTKRIFGNHGCISRG